MSGDERFIIIGGQGFIGAWIVKQLIEAHKVQPQNVLVADLAPINNHILSQILDEATIAAVPRVDVDVTDAASVRAAISSFKPHYVLHLAGLQVPTCRANPLLGARVNVDGTVAVLQACVENKVLSVVYASSAAACGPPEDYPSGVCHDDDRHFPRTHYGVYKLANEGTARIYWQDHGLPSVGLRPLTVYGVGREIGMTSGPTKAIKAALLGRDYTVQFRGETVFNYAQDIAELFIRCARAVASEGERQAWRCNIEGVVCSAENFVDEALKQVAARQQGGGGAANIFVKADAPKLPFPVVFDETSLKTLLEGNVPCTSVAEGIRGTVDIMLRLKEQGRLSDKDLEDAPQPVTAAAIEP